MKLGTHIKRIREIKNLTQKVMASNLQMSISGYNKIERDEVSINNTKLSQIAGVLGVTVQDIVNFDEKDVSINRLSKPDGHSIDVMDADIKKLIEEKLVFMQQNIDILENEIRNLKGSSL